MDMGYKIYRSLKLSEESAKYSVSPHIYEELIEFCSLEIKAITALDNELKTINKDTKDYIKAKMEAHF